MPDKDYQDFVIQISSSQAGHYSAQATDPRKGRTSRTDFCLPQDLDSFRGGVASRTDRDVRNKSRKPTLDPEAVGKLLYEALFQGKIGERFQQFRAQRLRIELVLEGGRSEAAGLHALPWEMLFDGHHLGLDSHYSIVRSVTDGQQASETFGSKPAPLAYSPRIRVLAVASDPKDLEALDLEAEKDLLAAEKLYLRHLKDVSRKGLQAQLAEGYHILHFMGHGGIVDGTPVLYFKDGDDGFRTVSGTDLANDLRSLDRKLWPNLVVLNSCHGSAVSEHEDDLRGVALELFEAGIPAVVAMRREIPDPAAIQFSLALYRQLAQDKTIDEAVVLGRSAISQLSELEGAGSWSVPVLFSKLPNGRLFRKPFPWKPLVATLVTLAVFAAAFLIYKALADIRVSFDEVSGTESVLWKDITPLKMGLAAVKGITPAQDQADYQVAIRLEKGKTSRLVAAIMDGDGKPLPEVILRLDSASTPEAIADLKEELLYRLLDRFGLLLDEKEKGEIKRLRPVAALVRRTNSDGVKAMEAGDLAAGESLFVKAIEADDDYATAHSNLAMLLFRQARFEEALPHAAKAAELVDVFPVFHYSLARVQLALKETEAAAMSLARAIDLDPGYVPAYHELGKIHLAEKDWQAARSAFAKCADFAPALKNLGRLSRMLSAPDEAIVYLEQALALPQDDSLQTAEILFLLALCYAETDRIDLACARVAAYDAILHAEHLAWRKQLDPLSCESVPVQSKARPRQIVRGGPFALLIPFEGTFSALAESGRRSTVSFRDALRPGQKLEADEGAQAILVCGTGNLINLEGPGSWLLDETLCSTGKREASGLFSLLLDPMERERLSLGPTFTLASRGESTYAVLDPIEATASSRPNLIWTDAPGITGWRLTLKDRRRRRLGSARIETVDHERLPLGNETVAVCRTSWPESWLSLQPGKQYMIEIKPIHDDESSDPILLVTYLRLIEGADALHDRLARIDQLEMKPVLRQMLRASAQRDGGDLGAAVAARLRLFESRGSDGDALNLAQAYLNAGLVEFAAPWFSYLLDRDIPTRMHADAEAGLGQAHLIKKEYEPALTYLARARALYHNSGNPLAADLIDENMAEARAQLAKLESN